MKLSVVIPAYNEARTIAETVARVQGLGLDLELEVIVVDDGSTDGTRQILAGLEGRPGLCVFFHPHNQGKGAAVRTGLAAATGEYILIQDADLEYGPEDYPRLLEPVLAGRAEVVYGSRFLGRARDMSRAQRLGNRFLTWATNVLFRAALTDMETGFKLWRADLVRGLKLKADGFDFEPEVTAKVLKQGGRIVEVPVSYTARGYKQGKKITWRDGLVALWTLIKYRFKD